jgi:hypothetical protein
MMSFKRRLERLERGRPAVIYQEQLPPGFWWAACGIVPLEECPPETRKLVEALYEPPVAEPDPIEQRIAEVEALAAARSGLPCGLKELPASPTVGWDWSP